MTPFYTFFSFINIGVDISVGTTNSSQELGQDARLVVRGQDARLVVRGLKVILSLGFGQDARLVVRGQDARLVVRGQGNNTSIGVWMQSDTVAWICFGRSIG